MKGEWLMYLFGQKNYASIVAPLKQMVTNLTAYMAEQQENIQNMEIEKAQIEANIATSQSEIAKSIN